jgi:hypothetical protein
MTGHNGAGLVPAKIPAPWVLFGFFDEDAWRRGAAKKRRFW